MIEYRETQSIGEAVGPGAVRWAKNERQPDIDVIPGLHDGADKPKWQHLRRPILAVDVLSDSTRQRDLWNKRDACARRRVPWSWIVDPDERNVTV